MTDFVVDTNIWAMASKSAAEMTNDELKCSEICIEWLKIFVSSDDRLIVDLTYRILTEYRANITKGSLAEQYLNQLQSRPLDRFVYMQVEFDDNDYAILPEHITFDDEDDRKFIAVAIQFDPYAPIYNATDTDWAEEKESLINQGFTIHELCEDYIQVKLKK